MDQLDFPSGATWEQRRSWFENLFDIDYYGGGVLASEHALGLLVDLQAVYCAGAFASCVIIACTTIDAHLQDVEGAEGGLKSTFSTSAHHAELEWLRTYRNRLVHFKPAKSQAITVDDHWEKRIAHEAHAKRAIKLVAWVLFENKMI